MTTQAYFLVAHGSRSPHPQRALKTLAAQVRTATAQSSIEAIGTGNLEFETLSLAEQILQFQASLSSDCEFIHILPVFLLPGNHVRIDIPAEIQTAQAQIAQTHSQVKVLLTPHLGSHPGLKKILLKRMSQTASKTWILMGHGSRRASGNRAIEQLAKSINAHPAYWVSTPGLVEQVDTLISNGTRNFGVLPYFLFSGKITSAIAGQVEELRQRYPEMDIELLSPLEPSPELATLLIELAQLTPVDISCDISPSSVANR